MPPKLAVKTAKKPQKKSPVAKNDIQFRKRLGEVETQVQDQSKKLAELRQLQQTLPQQIDQLRIQRDGLMGYCQAIREHLQIEAPVDPAMPLLKEVEPEKVED